jgi:phage shock protein C
MALFCAGCGVSLPLGARFCSVCGKAVTEPGPVPGLGARPTGPFLRPRLGRKIAGVCQGLANQYGWDVTLTRVITVLLSIFVFPVGIVAYVLFWVIVPEEPLALPAATNLNTTI